MVLGVPDPFVAGALGRLRQGLRKTGSSIAGVFTGTQIDDALYDELEAALGDAAPTPCPKCGSYNMTIRCHLGERLRTACSRCGHEREAAPKEDATRA